jgi:hypothetical protein
MKISAKRVVLVGLLAAGILCGPACKKGSSRPPIESSAIVGKWVEVKDQGERSPRAAPRKETKFVRHITLNPDNTYVMTLYTQSGEATKDKIEGTWKIEDNMLVFQTTSSTFGQKDERRDWAPESSDGIVKRNMPGEGTIEVLSVIDMYGTVTYYKRG